MPKIATDITQLIGNTPLLELGNFCREHSAHAAIIAKLEYFNPSGSVKDRAALSMVNAAERSGALVPGATIIEPTSGNTGIGLALVSASRGYRLIVTMPEGMSGERRMLMAAMGAQTVLTPGSEGMSGAVRKAYELRDATPGAVVLQQFENPANPEAHYRTTAEEIWRDTDGDIDIFVAGVGTGGTISGCGRRLKELKPEMEIVAVEPASSPVLEGGTPGPHGIQGIGAGFIPRTYDPSVADRVMAVSDDDALRTSREVAEREGLMAGISAGAALHAALRLALMPENKGKRIVSIIPDTGERYLSTILYDREGYPL